MSVTVSHVTIFFVLGSREDMAIKPQPVITYSLWVWSLFTFQLLENSTCLPWKDTVSRHPVYLFIFSKLTLNIFFTNTLAFSIYNILDNNQKQKLDKKKKKNFANLICAWSLSYVLGIKELIRKSTACLIKSSKVTVVLIVIACIYTLPALRDSKPISKWFTCYGSKPFPISFYWLGKENVWEIK